jgi:putative transposase
LGRAAFVPAQPPYCPQLNTIETVWRKLKGFLMPRRYYNSTADLQQALLLALNALGAVGL